MPPDEWEQYLKKPSSPATTGDDQWEQFKNPPAHDYTADIANVGKGFAQGIARYGVGAGQIAEDVIPGTRETIDRIPGARTAAHAAKEFALEPHATWGQSIGDVAGTIAPWAAGALTGVDEAAGGAALLSRAAPYMSGRSVALTKPAQWLADLAARAGFGAAGGGLEATEKGDLPSHLKGAEYGAATGAIASPRIVGPGSGIAAGGLAGYGVKELASTIGWEPTLGIISALGLGGHLGHLGLYTLARKAAAAARKPGAAAAGKIPSGVTGAEAGKQVGGSSDERSQ